MRRADRIAGCLSVMVVLLGSALARAEVRALQATAEASVVQTLSDGTVNSDRAQKVLDQSTPNLPLSVRAYLQDTDVSQVSFSAGLATGTFSDPRASQDENPKEFSLGSTLFSFDSGTTYTGMSRQAETRTVAFTNSDIGAEEGTPLLVTSHFFLDGFLALWGDLATSAAASTASVSIHIEQTRSQAASPVTLLDATLTLSHDSSGNAVVTAEGALNADNVVLDDSLGSVSPLGQTYFLTIPPLTLAYQYQATVGEEFTLKAEVRCDVANQPFTGAGVSLGVPLGDFLTAIGDTVRTPLSTASTTALGSSAARIPAKPLAVENGTQVQVLRPGPLWSAWPGCGSVGMEVAILSAVLPVMMVRALRRR